MDVKTANLRKLSYGLYAIGAMDGERPSGCIVNTVFQITSENPIVAVSMNRNNYTYELIRKNNRFSVNILSEKTEKKVITQLGFRSGKDENKLEGLSYEMKDGLPILNESICGAFTCEVVSMTETPTHFVILGKVMEAYPGTDDAPMTYKYYHEVIRGSAPKNAPSYVAPEVETKGGNSKWVCSVCGYVYEGDLTKEPDSFKCPICGVDKSKFKEEKTAEKWVCSVCGYIYEGDLTKEPDTFKCPLCGVDKAKFVKQ